ncbi:Putative F0F1-ATPase subunit Ca2+/Mg2+ transporter [Jatrophihabitans endophyticus]|uniref:Putative F0F1-ATPase subunit Ca2+/Mg2+ transporter n=1 Tax=Jatrophihabitans endophyticus TaxID=1206085 RepID=A0A1M5DJW8_9ACTN|nr:AtpZ/AtpI family protein [Jatrophihabitans endophyticus]SHF67318.1 Putative F0F1-ATPase subunit Ca2+/Mg2+ transporter [Jatrophihabitans endophyticus]
MAPESPSWTSLLGMGAVIAAQLAVGVALGLLLDSQLSTSPIFVLAGIAVGLAGGVVYAVTEFRKYLRNGQQ